METKRINLSEFKKIRGTRDLVGNFTSVEGEYQITDSVTGFYKSNGCMVKAKCDEDLRELLAYQVFQKMDIPCAKIIPVYNDEKQSNGCISVNILKENEEFVDIKPQLYRIFSDDEQYDQPHTVVDLIDDDIEQISSIQGINETDIENRRKYLIKYFYMQSLISNEDLKMGNRMIIYDKEKKTFRNPEYYDFGISFITDDFDSNEPQIENPSVILKQLYKFFPQEALEYGKIIEDKMNIDMFIEILNDNIYDDFDPEIKKHIIEQMNERIGIIKECNKQVTNGVEIDQENTEEKNKENQDNALVKQNFLEKFFSRFRSLFVSKKVEQKENHINNIDNVKKVKSWDLKKKDKEKIQSRSEEIAEKYRQGENAISNEPGRNSEDKIK